LPDKAFVLFAEAITWFAQASVELAKSFSGLADAFTKLTASSIWLSGHFAGM